MVICMGILNKFSSHGDKDYNRITDQDKENKFFLARSNILDQFIDRIKWHIFPKFNYVINFPTHLEIESSYACQMKCPMCLRRRLPKCTTFGMMDFDLFKKIIDEAAQRGVYSIKLSWRGEPLLNPRIVDMVKYAKEKGIKDVAFLTNGERLTPELTEKLVDAGLDWISFSIDGVGEIYERIRWPSTFKGIVEKVTYMKEYRNKKGLKKPLIRIQGIWGAIQHNADEYFEIWNNLADKVSIIADQKRFDKPTDMPRDPNYVCFEPWRRLVIGWNGKIIQCVSDYEEFGTIGDVTKESLYEIWHGEKFNKIRENVKNKKYMDNPACTMCYEPMYMYSKKIKLKDREMTINLYKGQELDISKMDARPKKDDNNQER